MERGRRGIYRCRTTEIVATSGVGDFANGEPQRSPGHAAEQGAFSARDDSQKWVNRSRECVVTRHPLFLFIAAYGSNILWPWQTHALQMWHPFIPFSFVLNQSLEAQRR